jgi:hypothetical protein
LGAEGLFSAQTVNLCHSSAFFNLWKKLVGRVSIALSSTFRQIFSVGILTWLLSFGYQLVFYFFYENTDRTLIYSKETVFSYNSGLLGDGILVPLVNIMAFLLIKRLEFRANRKYLFLALFFGLSFTLVAHYLQASLALTNWSMPVPYHWSGVGRFHFFFMWSETSFLFYALILSVYKRRRLFFDSEARLYLGLCVLALLAFAGTFLADYFRVVRLYA